MIITAAGNFFFFFFLRTGVFNREGKVNRGKVQITQILSNVMVTFILKATQCDFTASESF